jgi:Carbohydrate esterase 2 N-terminal/GDSL-like Lipase/Acylhydrolase family
MYKFHLALIAILSSLAMSSAQAEAISATDKRIAVMGRTQQNSDGSLRFAYPGVSFFMNTNAASLHMTASSNSGNAWLDVIIDDGEPKLIQIGQAPQNYELFRFEKAGKHKVQIINRTETWQAISTITQFELRDEKQRSGKLLAAPRLPKRKILVLGDSVTCAEMIDRVAGEKPNPRWNNARESYGMLMAKQLKAQVNLVCMGGRGLVRSWDGKTNEHNLPDFYQFSVPEDNSPAAWQHAHYQPDVILSAIGTNDFSPGIPERENYVATYVELVQKLLVNHTHAQIILTEGAIITGEKKAALIDYIAEVVKRVASPRVHSATSTVYPGDATDSHPTKAQHAAMANDLTPQLKTLMKW